MVQKKKNNRKSLHPAQTPFGYVITGLIMWLVGYLLSILAVDSGSLLQWAGVMVAAAWGTVRVFQGLIRARANKK